MLPQIILALVLLGPATAQDFDRCDNKIEVEKGERAGGPFFSVGMVMAVLAFAEKVCGAEPMDWRKTFSGYVRKHGCSAESPIGKEIISQAEQLQLVSAEDLIRAGRPRPSMTDEQMEAARKRTIDELGGCTALIEGHSNFVGRHAKDLQ